MSEPSNDPNKKPDKITNEKPLSLNPLGFDDILRDLLVIPPSQEPKEQERRLSKASKKKRRGSS